MSSRFLRSITEGITLLFPGLGRLHHRARPGHLGFKGEDFGGPADLPSSVSAWKSQAQLGNQVIAMMFPG